MHKYMKYLGVLIAGLVVGSGIKVISEAHAATNYTSGYEIQLLDRSTPLVDAPIAGEFLILNNVAKARLSICTCTTSSCAAQGGNLTGGTMQCWYQSPRFGWVVNLDLALAVGAPAQPCRTWSDMWSPSGNTGGKMFCSAVSVTAASGTHLQVHLEGIQ